MSFDGNLNDYPLWTALITPMSNDGSVDYNSLERLLKAQSDAGNGILLLGSTGEALNLDEDEKKKILEHSIKFLNENGYHSPVMVGVGGAVLGKTKEWVEYLNGLDVHAYLLVTPLYSKPGTLGQQRWFEELMNTSTRPCMLYNVPGRTGIKMSFDAVAALKDHKNLWAIKEASGSVEDFTKYVAAAPKARVYSGDDALLNDFTPAGAKGLVSVASNVWPAPTHAYTKACLSGDLANNQTDLNMWKDATNSLFVASNPIPAKYLMKENGDIATAVLRAPLDIEDMTEENKVKQSHENVIAWFQKL
ncbi:MAG: 4-hydroxy-tetrahydrodipicolinate synthase [Oligoflexia bacterium]|nr:4-hydroxy-tetrahydrodipicolinate synthase [Oligoflexia bacterium]